MTTTTVTKAAKKSAGDTAVACIDSFIAELKSDYQAREFAARYAIWKLRGVANNDVPRPSAPGPDRIFAAVINVIDDIIERHGDPVVIIERVPVA